MADLGFDFNDEEFDEEIIEEEETNSQQQPVPTSADDDSMGQENDIDNTALAARAELLEPEEQQQKLTTAATALDKEDDFIETEAIPTDEFPTSTATTSAFMAPSGLIRNGTEERPLEDDMDDELLADENITPVERVYAFKRNDALLNRLLLAKEISNALQDMEISKALTDVLPIMYELSRDTDDTVKETFASELDQCLLYFYKNAPHTFATSEKSFGPLLIRLLLDQSSGVASLGQQAIVSVTTELHQLASTTDDEQHLYQQVIDSEIFKNVIGGLTAIIDGRKKTPRLEDVQEEELNQRRKDEEEDAKMTEASTTNSNKREDNYKDRLPVNRQQHEQRRRSSATPGFESSLNIHHASSPSEDDLDQGEISLAKITCISLISTIAGTFDTAKCTEECLPIIEQLASDPLFYVRKEAATAIGSLSQVVDTKTAEERLLPLFRHFCEDQIWHVRRSCILSLPSLCGVLSERAKTDLTVYCLELFTEDVSRNVRSALADIVGELVAKFLPEDWEQTGQPGKLPEPLLQYFLSLGSSHGTNATSSFNSGHAYSSINGSGTSTGYSSSQMLKLEVDRAYICAYNFPVVVLTAGADYWNSHLRDTYLNLTKDYQIKVRVTFAHSLHDIARIIGPENTERDLVQIFALYLMDLDDVKQGVLEHLADFLGTLTTASRNEYIPILAEVWDGVSTNWHLRNILAGQLMDIAMLFDASRVVDHVLPLVVRACHDEFAAVRETGVKVFPVVLDVVKHAVEEDGESLSQADGYGDDITENKRNYALALLSHVMERLDEFARSENYRGRLVFAQICKALIEAGIGASDFASFFLPRLAPLAHDPVVNVRIAASRTIGTIYTNEPFCCELSAIAAPSRQANQSVESAHALEQMTYRFALDKDRDVRSFVMGFVNKDILEKQREKELKAANTIEKLVQSNKIQLKKPQSSLPQQQQQQQQQQLLRSDTQEEDTHGEQQASMDVQEEATNDSIKTETEDIVIDNDFEEFEIEKEEKEKGIMAATADQPTDLDEKNKMCLDTTVIEDEDNPMQDIVQTSPQQQQQQQQQPNDGLTSDTEPMEVRNTTDMKPSAAIKVATSKPTTTLTSPNFTTADTDDTLTTVAATSNVENNSSSSSTEDEDEIMSDAEPTLTDITEGTSTSAAKIVETALKDKEEEKDQA